MNRSGQNLNAFGRGSITMTSVESNVIFFLFYNNVVLFYVDVHYY